MDLTTEDAMKSYLTSTGYPTCHKVARLPEGFGGFTFRAYLGSTTAQQHPSTVIAKHVQPYAARAQAWKLDQNRLHFEHQALELLGRPELQIEGIRPPRVLRFDRAAWMLILEDVGDVPSLKGWLQPGVDLSRVPAIGAVVGKFLARVHNFSAGNEEVLKHFGSNETAKALSGTLYYANLPAAAAKWGYTDDFIREAATQGEKDVRESSEVLTLGDFWTGNILVTEDLELIVLDTELAKPGTADFDIGQMAAEMYCLAALREWELGMALLSSFLKGYRGSRKGAVDAAKVAIRIGAHLVIMMPQAWSNEASDTKIKEQVQIGVELIRLGIARDESGLRKSVVSDLLS